MQSLGTFSIPSWGSRTLRSILVATDLSPESANAMRHAIGIARTFDASLHVVYVVSSLGFTLCGPDVVEQAKQIVTREMDDLRASLVCSGSLKGVRSLFTVRQGDVAREIDQFAREEDTDLIIVGSRSRRGLLLRSVGEQIARWTKCPVLTVNAGINRLSLNERKCEHILFATDFGPGSLNALEYAVAVAGQFEATLTVLHVVSAAEQRRVTENPARSLVQDSRRRLHALPIPTPIADESLRLVEVGDVSDGILRTAAELSADLIVMGLSKTKNLFMAAHSPGTAAHQVRSHAHCPVLTVRA